MNTDYCQLPLEKDSHKLSMMIYLCLNYDPVTARPEWFILQALPVPPVTVRPSIILETGIRSEDDLTHKMVDIIRVNQRPKGKLKKLELHH